MPHLHPIFSRLRHLALLVLLGSTASLCLAQDKPPAGPSHFPQDREAPLPYLQDESGAKPPPSAEDLQQDLMCERLEVLEKYLSMSPEKLARIRGVIERIEQMSPEEKAEMRARIHEMRAMDPDRRQRYMKYQEEISWEDHMILRQYFGSLSREERRAMREALRDMNEDERRAHRDATIAKAKELGFEAPERAGPDGPGGGNPPPAPSAPKK